MRPTDSQLAIINSRLPGTKLKATDVEVLPFRVFNNKITDRYTIMTIEMARKLERDLNNGKAAFNSLHQSRSTLPVGRSISGRIKENTAESEWELQAMLYAALKRPDGSEFTEGKDLADRYNIGAAFACSAGVRVGFYKCNICGNDIRDYNKCTHILGRVYSVDEQPKVCVAYMTGRNIKDGVAEDCEIYEVSAVTAGGVADAGSMTEAFGMYEEGADPIEFKKAFSEKPVIERLGLLTVHMESETDPVSEHISQEVSMDEAKVKAMLKEHYEPLETAKAELEKELGKVKAEFEALKTELETAKEFQKRAETAEAELTTAKARIEELSGYAAEYVSLVKANGVKAGETVDETFNSLPLADLVAKNEAFSAAIAKLPVGQQSTDEPPAEKFAALTDEFYKA